MIRDEILERLQQHPFEPFVVRVTSGDSYQVRDSAQAALLKSGVFIAFPNSDRRVIIPFLHISAVETANGHRSSRRRKS